MSVAERHTGQTAMVRVSLAHAHGSQNTCPHASVCGGTWCRCRSRARSRSASGHAAAAAGGAFSPFASRSPAESSVAPAGLSSASARSSVSADRRGEARRRAARREPRRARAAPRARVVVAGAVRLVELLHDLAQRDGREPRPVRERRRVLRHARRHAPDFVRLAREEPRAEQRLGARAGTRAPGRRTRSRASRPTSRAEGGNRRRA